MNDYPTPRTSPRGTAAVCLAASLLTLGLTASPDTGSAQDRGAKPPIKPALPYLASLPKVDHGERVLAELFHAGTVDEIPLGVASGYPVLFHTLPELNWLGAQLWGGKTFKVVGENPDGTPVVRLDNQIVRTDTGSLLHLFDAYVQKSPVPNFFLGANDRKETVRGPHGTLDPVHISFLQDAVKIDDKPSIILNYFADETLPVIRRILDEIREVDAVNCPGVYLGRAHVRRCTSLSCGELPTVLVDTPESMTFATRYEWAFWTYFLLDFAPSASCDLTPALEAAETTLLSEGISVSLPAP